MFDDHVTVQKPPAKRAKYCKGGVERYLTEGAVMLAFGMHLMRSTRVRRIHLHPDGQHGKAFDFRQWLQVRGFKLTQPMGTTSYGGEYSAADGRTVLVQPTPGLGDVVAESNRQPIVAECKGGVVNSSHPGQQSRLRRGLCEAVGLLMTKANKGQQFAVVPLTVTTSQLAKRMAARAFAAGIQIALVDERGNVSNVPP